MKIKVKFKTSVSFSEPNLSVGYNEIVEIDQELAQPFLDAGVAEIVETETPEFEIQAEEKPKKRNTNKKKEE